MSKYNFPETFITDRFILEAVTPFHAEEAYEVIDRCRGYIGEFLEWCTTDYSLEDIEKFYETQHEQFLEEESFDYVIIDKETDAIIGSVGFVMKHNGVASVGYWLDQDQQGKGVMAEAVETLIDFAFNESKIEKIILQTEVENIKSQKVAEKAGFAFEGLFYTYRVNMHGNALDMYNFALLKDETKMQKLKELEPKLKEIYGF